MNIAREVFFRIAEAMVPVCLSAGREILEEYSGRFSVERKDDSSPVTEADRRAHRVIVRGLADFPVAPVKNLPVLSEEGKELPFEDRRWWERFWMVDPLDGTKEFVKRNGEFTVNIALIEQGRPEIGFVYVPLTGSFYFGSAAAGAFKSELTEESAAAEVVRKSRKLPAADAAGRGPGMSGSGSPDVLKVVASRSHMNAETEEFVRKLGTRFGKPVELTSSGSSIKLCRIAEGSADVYPRFAPTMEWDTAAADAVCRAAGSYVVDPGTCGELIYNKADLRNPPFIAARDDRYRNFICFENAD